MPRLLVLSTTLFCLLLAGLAVAGPRGVQTQSGEPLSDTSARLSGYVDSAEASITYRFEYGTSTAYGASTPATTQPPGEAKQTISGLAPGTTYHFRLVASDSTGETAGQDATFPTRPKDLDPDRDGTKDPDDACPQQLGPPNTKGCPDSDMDRIADAQDACPNASGTASNGCPERDRDGIPDASDECPAADGAKDLQGCPDGDQDGVNDKRDVCEHIPDDPRGSVTGCPPFTFAATLSMDTDFSNNWLNFDCLPVRKGCTVTSWLTVSKRTAKSLGLKGRRLAPVLTSKGDSHGSTDEYRHGQVRYRVPDALVKRIAKRRAIEVTVHVRVVKPGSETSPGKLEFAGKHKLEFRRGATKGCESQALLVYPRPFTRKRGTGHNPAYCPAAPVFHLRKG